MPQSKIPWQEEMDQPDRLELEADEDMTEGPSIDEWTINVAEDKLAFQAGELENANHVTDLAETQLHGGESLKKMSSHTHAQLGNPSEPSKKAHTTMIKDHWGTDSLPMLSAPLKSDRSTS